MDSKGRRSRSDAGVFLQLHEEGHLSQMPGCTSDLGCSLRSNGIRFSRSEISCSSSVNLSSIIALRSPRVQEPSTDIYSLLNSHLVLRFFSSSPCPQVLLMTRVQTGVKVDLCQIIQLAVVANGSAEIVSLFYRLPKGRTMYDLSALGNTLDFQKIVWDLFAFPFFVVMFVQRETCFMLR